MASVLVRRHINKNPKIHNDKVHWSDKQKLDAVATYLMVGKWAVVSDATKIPIDTLKKWKGQDWWKDYEKEIKAASRLEVSGKLQKIIHKASDVVLDRLEGGDIYMDQQGNIKRRPIGAKVASEILNRSIDKQVLIDKIQEAPEVQQEAIMDRLTSIQNQLRKNSKAPTVIDVTPEKTDDAISLPT